MSVYQPIQLSYATTADLSGAAIPNPSTSEGFITYVRSTGASYQLALNSGAPLSSSALATMVGGDSRWLKLDVVASSYSSSPFFVPVQRTPNGPACKIAVVDFGPATPTDTYVLIPGSGGDLYTDWQYQIAQLVAHGNRVIVINLRGQGDSDKPDSDYDMNEFADDVFDVLESLSVSGAKLIGHSFGASVALHYAVRHNNEHISKLILTSLGSSTNGTLLPPLTYLGVIIEIMGSVAPPINGDYAAAIALLTGLAFTGDTTPASADTVAQFQTMLTQKNTPAAIVKVLDCTQNKTGVLEADAPLVTIPTLVCQGANDVLTTLLMAQEATGNAPPGVYWPVPIAGATLQTFADSGHAPQLAEQALFNSTIMAF